MSRRRGPKNPLFPGIKRERKRDAAVNFRDEYRLRLPDGTTKRIWTSPTDLAGFIAACQAALGGEALPNPNEKTDGKFLLAALVTIYLTRGDSHYFTLDKDTQTQRRSYLSRLKTECGDIVVYVERNDKRIMVMTSEEVQQILDKKQAQPGAMTNLRRSLRGMFKWAKANGLVPENPTLVATVVPPKNPDGHETWTEAQVAQFKQRHKKGSKAYLAITLCLETSQRRSDLHLLGPQHYKLVPCNGRQVQALAFTQWKNRKRKPSHVVNVVTKELKEAIDAARLPATQLTFLTNEHGRPFASASSFGEWFRDRMNEAGLTQKGLGVHGVRKTSLTRDGDAGIDAFALMAKSGHRSIREVQRYTEKFNRTQAAIRGAGAEVVFIDEAPHATKTATR